MIILDTHVLICDALAPARLSARARKAIEAGFARRDLACSDFRESSLSVALTNSPIRNVEPTTPTNNR